MDYQRALAEVVAWAERDENVRAVVLTGSAAAVQEHPLSDRDIELHVRNASPLVDNDDWWNRLGEVLAVERLEDAEERPTRLIYYVGGKLDFTLIEIGDDHHGEFDRPFVFLHDKDGAAAHFSLSKPTLEMPDANEFDQCVNWAWAAALMCAKAIARDEPWSVKIRDFDLKAELLRMIEWDHNLRYNGGVDVRYVGTRMRTWMDPDIQQRVEECWGSFSLDASRNALVNSVALFAEVAERVAATEFFPNFDHAKVQKEISRILQV